MKQLLQSLNNGGVELAAIPAPALAPGHVLIRSSRSLISAGTERMLLDFGRASLVEKARQQPEKVRMVLDKIRSDGFVATARAVLNKLDQPLPLGYCNVGTVLKVGEGIRTFSPGDRVVSNGKHAELVTVPANLCARVPGNVSDEEAVFGVVGSIALQGIRLVQPTLGEAVAVTGLGLIGLMTVQLLRAHGCRVLGLDFDSGKLALARRLGAEVVDLSSGQDPLPVAQRFSRSQGMDAVIITASTKSSDPVHQAALMCRKRGRIVLVGVTGLELSRADFYEKELSFQVSCSYGPGRYDPEYEERGHDYPVGFVRWTEQRNFEAVLDMLAERRLDTSLLISERVPFDRAQEAYDLIGSDRSVLGIVLEYPASDSESLRSRSVQLAPPRPANAARAVVGFIGAGNYASQILMPAFRKTGARMKIVATNSGVSAVHAGRKHGFEDATTDSNAILADPEITAVAVATRHDTHARLVCDALRAGKHVFVEKPLALSLDELREIETVYSDATVNGGTPVLMIGFNRRFAPQIVRMKTLLASVAEAKSFIMTVNAGGIPKAHWTQDARQGGGRIIGEACHFIDLLRFLAGAAITRVQVLGIGGGAEVRSDKVSLQLGFEDGSFGTVHYLANGHRSFPKERLEVFAAGRILQLENFRRLTGYGWPRFRSMNLWRQNKGQVECAAAFVRAIEEGNASPIPFEQIAEVSRVAIEAAAVVH